MGTFQALMFMVSKLSMVETKCLFLSVLKLELHVTLCILGFGQLTLCAGAIGFCFCVVIWEAYC